VSYSVVKAIGDQASKDLGFKVTMQNLDTSAAINRFITQPDSVDIADVEGWQSKLATKRGVLQGIEVKKIKEFDNILPIFTKGELEGHKIPREGISPYEAMYIAKPADTELHDGVTDWMTFLPQVYNADSIGYRRDLVGHEVTEWKDLIDPKFKGKAAILDVPAIGIMDAAVLSVFKEAFPRIQVRVRCALSTPTVDRLLRGEVDIALVTRMNDFTRGLVVHQEQLVWMAGEHPKPTWKIRYRLRCSRPATFIASMRSTTSSVPAVNGKSPA
jgi:hypothetical protein